MALLVSVQCAQWVEVDGGENLGLRYAKTIRVVTGFMRFDEHHRFVAMASAELDKEASGWEE